MISVARKRVDEELFERNVSMLDREIARRAEKRIAVFSEPAFTQAERLLAAAKRGISRRELLPSLADALPSPLLHDSVLPENRALLTSAFSPLAALDRVAFIRALLERLTFLGAPIVLHELLDIKEPVAERVAYFRNPYTDEAYDSFAAAMKNPTVQYTDSFRASSEAVREGSAGFCILPVENTAGELAAFADMADEFGLVRVATARVFHADGTDVTHFALYAAAFPAIPGKEATLLRFSARLPDDCALAAHIGALSPLGASLLRFSAEETEEGDGLRLVALCRTDPEERIPLLTYLSAFAKDCRFLGLYKEFEQ